MKTVTNQKKTWCEKIITSVIHFIAVISYTIFISHLLSLILEDTLDDPMLDGLFFR